jgi:hypothetical protein
VLVSSAYGCYTRTSSPFGGGWVRPKNIIARLSDTRYRRVNVLIWGQFGGLSAVMWSPAVSSWSFHLSFLSGLMSAKTFPAYAKKHLGVSLIEYFEGDYYGDFLNAPPSNMPTACARPATPPVSASAV